MRIRISHINGTSFVWDFPGKGPALRAAWAQGAVPFDVVRGLPRPRAPWAGTVEPEDPALRWMPPRYDAHIFLASPAATGLSYGRNPPHTAYPFPDDPYRPDVDLDFDARWFRHLESEVLDDFVGKLWTDLLRIMLRAGGRSSWPTLSISAEVVDEGACDRVVAWCAEVATARTEDAGVARELSDAIRIFRSAYLRGDDGLDFGAGVIALLRALDVVSTLLARRGDPFADTAGNARLVWESRAREAERLCRRA